MISVMLCMLVMVLLSVVAFVLVQVIPPQRMFKNRSVPPDIIENGVTSEEDYRKREAGLGLVRTARKLEDHAEYKRSLEENYSEFDEEDDYADEDDELILNGYGDNGYDDEEDYNPVFDMKYFDFSMKGKSHDSRLDKPDVVDSKTKVVDSSSSFKTPNVKEKWKNLPEFKIVNDFKMEIIENGVVFSRAVEALLEETELTDAKVGQIQDQLRTSQVKVLQEPTWERCGRPKNQWLEMVSGEAACARYRYPDDYLLVGEVLSFYLSRLLSVGHVPPTVLSQPTGPRWKDVQQYMQRAGWGEAPVVVLTPWLPGLVRDHMPSILLEGIMKNTTLNTLAENQSYASQSPSNYIEVDTLHKLDTKGSKQQTIERDLKEHKEPVEKKKKVDLMSLKEEKDSEKKKQDDSISILGSKNLKELSKKDLIQLLQWSDLLVFDYLTGNYDRVAYMQDAAQKEGRPQILSGTIHNLVRRKTTDALWLLDNESGLMDAYTLLYSTADPIQSSRFHAFHKQMLESMCIFRRSTMEAVLGLHRHPEPHVVLVDFVKQHEALFHLLPDPLGNPLFVKYFPLRVKEVHDWISKCIDKVPGHSSAR